MERVKQLETYQLRVGKHLGFTMEITLPAFKPESKIQPRKRETVAVTFLRLKWL
jgi:hypothetical protein